MGFNLGFKGLNSNQAIMLARYNTGLIKDILHVIRIQLCTNVQRTCQNKARNMPLNNP